MLIAMRAPEDQGRGGGSGGAGGGECVGGGKRKKKGKAITPLQG